MVDAMAHNARSIDMQFILKRAIFLKISLELIMNVLKVVCMRVRHLTSVDSASYLAMTLRKLPEFFGLSATKSLYPHYFNTKANLDYVGPMPDKINMVITT
jgi:hypothetical protein